MSNLPMCCGQKSVWVVLSVNISYAYCRECKKEVLTTNTAKPDNPYPINTNKEHVFLTFGTKTKFCALCAYTEGDTK
jgi:hypothetical protein